MKNYLLFLSLLFVVGCVTLCPPVPDGWFDCGDHGCDNCTFICTNGTDEFYNCEGVRP